MILLSVQEQVLVLEGWNELKTAPKYIEQGFHYDDSSSPLSATTWTVWAGGCSREIPGTACETFSWRSSLLIVLKALVTIIILMIVVVILMIVGDNNNTTKQNDNGATTALAPTATLLP